MCARFGASASAAKCNRATPCSVAYRSASRHQIALRCSTPGSEQDVGTASMTRVGLRRLAAVRTRVCEYKKRVRVITRVTRRVLLVTRWRLTRCSKTSNYSYLYSLLAQHRFTRTRSRQRLALVLVQQVPPLRPPSTRNTVHSGCEHVQAYVSSVTSLSSEQCGQALSIQGQMQGVTT